MKEWRIVCVRLSVMSSRMAPKMKLLIDWLIDCTNCSTTISSSHPWTLSWFCDEPRRWSVFHPIFGVLLQKVTDCQRRKTQKEMRHSLKFGGVQYAVSQKSQILFYRILSLAVQMTVSNVCIYTWIKVSWVTFVCICAFFYLGPFVCWFQMASNGIAV